MSRFSSLRSLLLRPILRQQQQIRQFSISTLIKNSLHSTSKLTPTIPLSTLAIPFLSSPSSIGFRSYSSDADLPGNMVLVKSEDQLKDSLKKVEDESSPAVFYFTAPWCGPCRFVWPEIKKLSESLPGVKFYKIDIDEVGSGPTLGNLSIFSVPTLHFFKNGKKAAEVVGADSKKIKDVSSSLYKFIDEGPFWFMSVKSSTGMEYGQYRWNSILDFKCLGRGEIEQEIDDMIILWSRFNFKCVIVETQNEISSSKV